MKLSRCRFFINHNSGFMVRDMRFDIARSLCMIYVVGVFHLTQYLGDSQEYYLGHSPVGSRFVSSTLGVFSLISGYFIGIKYGFKDRTEVLQFYKKRLVRFFPLFFIAALLLWLIGFNTLGQTICALMGVGCLVPENLYPQTLWYISMLMIFYLITPTLVRGAELEFSLCYYGWPHLYFIKPCLV